MVYIDTQWQRRFEFLEKALLRKIIEEEANPGGKLYLGFEQVYEPNKAYNLPDILMKWFFYDVEEGWKYHKTLSKVFNSLSSKFLRFKKCIKTMLLLSESYPASLIDVYN